MTIENVKSSTTIPVTLMVTKDVLDSDEDRKRIFEFFGITAATDTVTLEASVGSWLFDIYCALTELPKAPYPRFLEKTRRQKMAEQFRDDEQLDIAADVQKVVADALMNEEQWKKVKLSTSFKVGDEVRYDLLSPEALELFPEVRDVLLSLCQSS
jgi:hypothetical protein